MSLSGSFKISDIRNENLFISYNNKMEDDELKAIRAQRMAQMQGQAVSLITVDIWNFFR